MLHFAPWKVVLIVLVCLAGLGFTGPNFLDRETAERLPAWLPHKQINLGLDLQGGSHLLLEVDTRAVLRERLEALTEAIRAELRDKRIGYVGLGVQGESVQFRVREAGQTEAAVRAVRDLAVPVDAGLLSAGTQDIEVTNGPDGAVVAVLSEAAIAERQRSAVEQSIEIVRRRIDELGTREPSIQRQGESRILVQVPGLDDPQRLKAVLGKTAKMVFRMVDVSVTPEEGARGRVPLGSDLLESDARRPDGSPDQQYVVRKRVLVGGDSLVDAQPTFQQGEPVVSFRFDSVGAKRFADATRENVGRPFAIVLDGRVISAPVIREPILGGSGIISGSFTVESARDLALLLRAGALPAPLDVVEERTVGPALGADSIRAGQIAAISAFVLVVVFMVLAYGLFGLAANTALIVNLFLLTGALSVLQATLTLPGIAGIVLTIGMAVDANVLVFERIREEVRAGKSPFAAMEAGYQRAFGTIFDANLTTLIAAVILFAMGSGPVKGFAVTLGIGIVTSVFTAVVVTRLLLVFWLRRTRPAALPI